MRTCYVYALCEPGTRTVRYVGKTVNMTKRLQQHLTTSKKTETHLGRWLRSLCGPPSLIKLSEVPEFDGSSEEIRFVAAARMLGMDLVNATDGGEGVTMTPEIRAKLSAQKRGAKNPCFGKSGPAHNSFGKKRSPEACENIRRGKMGNRKGVSHTPEWCAAISEAHKGKKLSPEHCAAISKVRTGVPRPPFTDEHRKNMSAAKTGKNNPMFGKFTSMTPRSVARRLAALSNRPPVV